MKAERIARLLAIGVSVGLLLAVLIARWSAIAGETIELRGRMAETGGWTPDSITAVVGEPIRLRLTSDDVMHGFAIGQSDLPAVDVKPGEMTETTITFDRPGKYVFYCTRWCGPNHWRMRGTIEVSGPTAVNVIEPPPLYVALGIDLDAPHPASAVPQSKPSVARGASLGVTIPSLYLTTDYYRAHSPAEAWQAIRAESFARDLTEAEIWDLVAFIWRSNTSAEVLGQGAQLYVANCAACHGETGTGDGVMAASLANRSTAEFGHGTTRPVNFTNATNMLGATPVLLQGKIIRGGMGTGMPYWGPIFTDAQTWALVGYLWTFQFEMEDEP